MKRPTADMVVRFAHRGRRRGTARVLITLAFGLVLLAPSADAQLPPEELTITQLDNVLRPHWVWVNDLSWNHMPDGRAYLLDADTGVLLGMISGGYSHSMLQVTPRGDRIAVPGIYFSRGSRGTRTDVVTLYDSRTLTPGREIIVIASPASAPRLPATRPGARQPLTDELIAQRTTIADDHAQLAPILVEFAAGDRLEIERTGVEQIAQPVRRLHSQRIFAGALGVADFRRVYIGNANLAAFEPEGVAIDHAGLTHHPAQLEMDACARPHGSGDR